MYVCVIQRDGCVNAARSPGGCQLRTAARADMPRLFEKKPALLWRTRAGIGLWLTIPVRFVGMIDATVGDTLAIVQWTPGAG
jgi:hypothetical protein